MYFWRASTNLGSSMVMVLPSSLVKLASLDQTNGYVANLTPLLSSAGISTDDLPQGILDFYRYDGTNVVAEVPVIGEGLRVHEGGHIPGAGGVEAGLTGDPALIGPQGGVLLPASPTPMRSSSLSSSS